MSLKRDLNTRYELLLKTIDELNYKISILPEGRIIVKHHKDSVYYEWYRNNDSCYLNKNNAQTINDLSQKHYLKKVLKAANQEAQTLDKALKLFPEITIEDIYDSLPQELRMNTKPIVLGDEEYANRWLAQPYQGKSSNKDSTFVTLKGNRVRSKSELVIADRLWANGIPYKYECPLLVGNEIIHPDFTILKMSSKKIVYLEHCGKMDDPGYTENMVNRVNLYALEKIFQGDRLFFTFETSATPLNTDVLDEMIRTNFK